MDLLRDRLAKAEAKVARAEKSLESAKTEHTDLQIAQRVMAELTGESPPTSSALASAAVAERQRIITMLLGVGQNAGRPPADVFETYRAISAEDITIDTFRTTIWRMKGQSYTVAEDIWLICGDNGIYWKEPGSFGTRERAKIAEARERFAAGNVEFDDEPPF